ncbi:MAG: hypothetical protein KDA55_08495, partial [Planctomycetales bacterium]|nr:hypothetical protein [Planctomycetales bacterium]
KIKFRESFRPFAPMVMRERASEYFEMRPDVESPYMLLVAPVHPNQRHMMGEDHARAFGIDKLNFCRSTIPAVTHVDYSARVQTVDADRNPLMHRLIAAFLERTGCPVLVNTSFNVRGEPIVCTPEEAYHGFLMTEMDVLVLGRHILLKETQSQRADAEDKQRHLAQFQLD